MSRGSIAACLAVVCLAAGSGPAMAELITNGDFESFTAGKFDG